MGPSCQRPEVLSLPVPPVGPLLSGAQLPAPRDAGPACSPLRGCDLCAPCPVQLALQWLHDRRPVAAVLQQLKKYAESRSNKLPADVSMALGEAAMQLQDGLSAEQLQLTGFAELFWKAVGADVVLPVLQHALSPPAAKRAWGDFARDLKLHCISHPLSLRQQLQRVLDRLPDLQAAADSEQQRQVTVDSQSALTGILQAQLQQQQHQQQQQQQLAQRQQQQQRMQPQPPPLALLSGSRVPLPASPLQGRPVDTPALAAARAQARQQATVAVQAPALSRQQRLAQAKAGLPPSCDFWSGMEGSCTHPCADPLTHVPGLPSPRYLAKSLVLDSEGCVPDAAGNYRRSTSRPAASGASSFRGGMARWAPTTGGPPQAPKRRSLP